MKWILRFKPMFFHRAPWISDMTFLNRKNDSFRDWKGDYMKLYIFIVPKICFSLKIDTFEIKDVFRSGCPWPETFIRLALIKLATETSDSHRNYYPVVEYTIINFSYNFIYLIIYLFYLIICIYKHTLETICRP